MMRDLFEAGLNEAAGLLAATYGGWSFVRSVERSACGGRSRRGRHPWQGSEGDNRESWMLADDFSGTQGPTLSVATNKARVCRRATLDRGRVNIGWARRRGWRAWRHELSTKPESFEPLFVGASDGEVDARPWCMGFYAVIKLRLLAWSRLFSTSTLEHGLLLPILFHCVDTAGRPVLDAQRRGLANPPFARNAWRNIPTVVEALRQFWMPTRFARGA